MRRETLKVWFGPAVMLLMSIAPSLISSEALALTCSPYSDFQSLPASSIATLQVKLTYVGVSDSAFHSLAVTALGNAFDPSQFSACQQLVGAYFNDTTLNRTFATPAELQTLINNVGTLSAVTAGGVAANPYLSFSLSISQPSTKAFEAIVDQSTSGPLMAQITSALAGEKTASQMLAAFGCNIAILPAGTPTDVTSAFTVTLSGVRLRRDDGFYVGTLKVANNSAGTPASPVSVALVTRGNVRLANGDGITCGIPPGGKAFINLPSIPAQGSSVTVPVQFRNPDRETISITAQVFSGPGAR